MPLGGSKSADRACELVLPGLELYPPPWVRAGRHSGLQLSHRVLNLSPNDRLIRSERRERTFASWRVLVPPWPEAKKDKKFGHCRPREPGTRIPSRRRSYHLRLLSKPRANQDSPCRWPECYFPMRRPWSGKEDYRR